MTGAVTLPHVGCHTVFPVNFDPSLVCSPGLVMVAGIAALAAAPSGPQAAECAAAFMLGATMLSYIAGEALPQKVRCSVYCNLDEVLR